MAGGFSGTVDFDPTGGTHELTAGADADVFGARYDAAGGLDWVRTAAGATGLAAGQSMDGALALAVYEDEFDASDVRVFVGGAFVYEITFDCDGPVTRWQTSDDDPPSLEAFVAYYDEDGTCQWVPGGNGGARTDADDPIDLIGVDVVTSLAVDNLGQLYVGGAYSGSSFLGVPVGGGAVAAYGPVVAKINTDEAGGDYGTVRWVTSGVPQVGADPDPDAPPVGHGAIRSLVMTGGSLNDLYVLGHYAPGLDFGYVNFQGADPGYLRHTLDEGTASSSFVAALRARGGTLDGEGAVLWAYELQNTPGADVEDFVAGTSIATDGDANVYVGGRFSGTTAEGLAANGTYDGFLARFNRAAFDPPTAPHWIQRLGGFPATLPAPEAEVLSLQFDDQGGLYVVGRYKQLLEIGEGGAQDARPRPGALGALRGDVHPRRYAAVGA